MIRLTLVILLVIVIASVGLARHLQTINNLMPPTAELANWNWKQDGESSGQLSVDHGALRCDTLAVDGTPWHLALTHHGIAVQTGCRYRVAFSAKADRRRKISLSADQGGYSGHYDQIGLDATFLLDRDWNSHEITFTATGSLGHVVTLPVFLLGDATGSVWIKDIIIEQIN